jgi:hypothetical protein
VFNEVPELYDRVRPAYPGELFEDLVAITGMDGQSSVLEVGAVAAMTGLPPVAGIMIAEHFVVKTWRGRLGASRQRHPAATNR